MAREKKTEKAAAPKAKAKTKTPAKARKAEKAKPPARGPLNRLKAAHGSKAELARSLAEPLARADEDTEALSDRLSKASNAQLLRLAKVVEAVKAKYGDRDKLIQALGSLAGKAKDKDYLAKLGSFSLPKLWDLARGAEKRARA